MPLYSPSVRAIEFQKAMVFVDGANLFYRLDARKLKLHNLNSMYHMIVRGRDVVRIYLYTSQPYYEKAVMAYAEKPFKNLRVVLGEAIRTADGNFKEKGVDALLVADLIYHAASKNCEFALLVSVDTDFAHALRRVEDFGCRTGVVSVCAQTPPLLRRASDEVHEITEDDLVNNEWAKRA